MEIKSLNQILGKAISFENENLLVSHYASDGDLITLFTDKGERSFFNFKLNDALASMQLIANQPSNGIAIQEESSIQTSNLYFTHNYDLFSFIESNRKVDPRHISKLASAIKKNNLLHLNPILVNSNYSIIDGQHRLGAAKTLGLPIYYIIDNHINKSDIAALNSNQKNWTLEDYIKFHSKEGKPSFKILDRFLKDHPTIPISGALTLLSGSGTRDTKAIREGFVDTSNIDKANRIAEFITWLMEIYPCASLSNTIQAIRDIFSLEGFDVEVFKSKILGQPRSLVKCINRKQYLDMFLEIYNYKQSKNRISKERSAV